MKNQSKLIWLLNNRIFTVNTEKAQTYPTKEISAVLMEKDSHKSTIFWDIKGGRADVVQSLCRIDMLFIYLMSQVTDNGWWKPEALPKHIVFLSQLLLLFRFCHSCKADNPLVETREVGSKVMVTTICSNPKCPQKTTMWHSQPMMPGTKISAGNFLICMATLLGGGSFSKVRQMFLHMGLGCVSLSTYFRYQKVCKYCKYLANNIH